ncbi:hypothetical protein ACO0LM_08430 [Undibacterium sp. Di26W]|uniref:hypothetical protein n=1 Tax=Undibacterium sp. Di26W TaxID=3413035 RepID=UPI003BF1F29C
MVGLIFQSTRITEFEHVRYDNNLLIPAFPQAVHPALAVFQVGYLNRYHHPKTEVYARYADFGIKRLRSDESGAITLQFGASLTTSQFRQENARYWFDR